MKAAILTDTTLCIGCRQCVLACKRTYRLPPDKPRRWELEDGLSATSWTAIASGPRGVFVRRHCLHCLEPACVSACPVGALRKTPEGPVVYEQARCMGCRYCMMACPYGIPRYEWDHTVPYVRKCILCYGRLRAGEQPACTRACPTRATIFGDRDALIQEAHRRIQAAPHRYLNRVWGAREAGGTSVLFISDVDISEVLGFQRVGSRPLPSTTATAMVAVPFVFTGVVGAMAGLNWIIGRRIKRQEERQHE